MTNPKRYDLELEETGGDARVMAPDENGGWVKWEDYERLRALFHEITELTCTEHDCTPCRRIDEVAERALSDSSEPNEPLPPAILADAHQDVVHTDTGAVRAGRSVKSTEVSTRVTVGCSQCTATVSLPQRDGLVDIASLGLWYFSTPTGWRCPAHTPAQRT